MPCLEQSGDRLQKDGQFRTDEVREFIEQLALIEDPRAEQICYELDSQFFRVIREEPIQPYLETFLQSYRKMVADGSYPWSYAEDIARYMAVVFDGPTVAPGDKTTALELATIAATRQNRFAAMDTCQAMVQRIADDELAMRVRELILAYPDTCIASTEATKCNSRIIITLLEHLQSQDKSS